MTLIDWKIHVEVIRDDVIIWVSNLGYKMGALHALHIFSDENGEKKGKSVGVVCDSSPSIKPKS